jgi:hypothetical protein
MEIHTFSPINSLRYKLKGINDEFQPILNPNLGDFQKDNVSLHLVFRLLLNTHIIKNEYTNRRKGEHLQS